MNIVKRPASSKEDREFARKAHHAAYQDVVIKQFGIWDEVLQDQFFDKAWSGSAHEIVWCNEKRCGYFAAQENEYQIDIHEIVIIPEYQGLGIGTSILEYMLASAKLKNVPVYLQVLKENKAIELYKKLGFIELSQNTTHTKMVFNFQKI